MLVVSGWFRRNVKIGNSTYVFLVSISSFVRQRREQHTPPLRDCQTRGFKKFKNLGMSGELILESFLGLDSVASKRMYLSCCLLVPAGGGLARVFSP